MMDGPNKTLAHEVAQALADALLSDRRFALMVEGMVLRVLVAREEIVKHGIVDAFLARCDEIGIVPRWREEDEKLVFRHANSLQRASARQMAEIRAILTVYREPIAARLRRMQDMAKMTEERMAAERNGTP